MLVLLWAVAFLAVGVRGQDDVNRALSDPLSPDETAFLEWASQKGVKHEAITLANFTNPIFSNFKLRGVKANRQLVAGDMLLAVPGEFMLSSVNALASDTVGVVFQENPSLFADDQIILTVFMLYEMQHAAQSKWAQHLAVLPTRFHTACEYSANELRQIEGSVLFEEAKARTQLFLDEYNTLFPLLAQKYPNLFSLSATTFTVYKYVRLLVQTRAFGMHVGGRVVIGIVPLGDMMNHSPRSKVQWKYDYAADEFRMYTEEPIAPGTQVYNNYGPRSNRRLLLDFGFVIEDNPFDFVEMPAPVSSGYNGDKSVVLSDRGLTGRMSYTVRLGELPEELLFAARVARATTDEIAAYRKHMEMMMSQNPDANQKVLPKVNASISLRNEIATLSWLQDTSAAQLSRYRDTYESDLAMLEAANEDMPRSLLNSLILRFSEKRVYKFLHDFSSVHTPILEYYQRFTTGNALTNTRIALAATDYMRNVLLPLQGSILERAFVNSQYMQQDDVGAYDRENWGGAGASSHATHHAALVAHSQ